MTSILKKFKYYFQSLEFVKFISNWYLIPLGYLNILDFSKGYILKLKNGYCFKVVHYFDALVLKETFFSNDYRFVASNKPMNIIDIGANIGDSSIFFASQNTKAKVFAFEPSKTTYMQLVENISLNHMDKQITPINMAVYKNKTKLKLFNPGPSGMRNTFNNRHSKQYELVSTITLKDVFLKYKLKKCDFLKLDCEGGEYDILKSTPKAVFDKIQKIALECHLIPGHTPEELIDLLQNHHYCVQKVNHNIESDICYLYAERL